MEKDVWHYIETYGLLEERREVGAAVSGGPDSMALLICLQNLSRDHGFTVTALHLDHGTRNGASSDDARFVSAFCAEHGIALVCETADVPKTARERGIGLELAGRLEREAFFRRMVERGVVDVVATAHHMDDNAESVLHHLIRGCGTRGLCGISPKRDILIRPFLGVTRQRIERYLAENGIAYRVDASNADTSFDRNFIRHALVPLICGRLNPSFSAAAARLSRTAARDEEYLSQRGRELLTGACRLLSDKEIRIDAAVLGRGHPAVTSRTVREALRMIGRSEDVEQGHIEAILEACRGLRTGTVILLGDGLMAEISYGELIIAPVRAQQARWQTPLAAVPGRTVLPDGAVLQLKYVKERGDDTRGECRVYVDADRLPKGALVRFRKPGDRFRPLGGPGTKKLKDFFIDRKVPRVKRDGIPLLADGDNVLWIMGEALSEDLAVREGTSRICRMDYYESGVSDWAEEENAVSACGGDARAACEEV